MDELRERVSRVLAEIPDGVTLVAAAKTRTPEQARAAVEAGVAVLGHNYVQEAEVMVPALADLPVKWHLIGHLQRNKAKKAARLFDVVETVDSLRLAAALERALVPLDKTLEVLLEVNSGEESAKAGVLPRDAVELARQVAELPHLRVVGLMTMGPLTDDAEEARPYFRMARELRDEIAALELPGVSMGCLSMGMSASWRVAVEEGATQVRIGTALFGPRIYNR